VPGARSNSAVGRRRLGPALKRLRDQAGVTIEQVADRLKCSSSKISRIENGHIRATMRDVDDMLDFYGAGDEVKEQIRQLVKDSRSKGWWTAYGQVFVGTYVGLEAAATSIEMYEAQLVPDLLQTNEYAKATISASSPFDATTLDGRIDVRERRRAILKPEEPAEQGGTVETADGPTTLFAILDEAVLHRVIGSPAVMREQMDHLLEMATWPNIDLRVLPFDQGAHAATDGTFSILSFDQATDDFAFVEHARGGLFLGKPEDLVRYRGIFEAVENKALAEDESLEMIRMRRDRYR